MAEYIEREAAIKAILDKEDREIKNDYEFCLGLIVASNAVSDAPAADVQPVRHGRWKPYDLTYGRSIYYCTACNRSAVVPTALDEPIFNYCPNCGTKMDGGEP